jgi:hypothetical protein
MNWWTLGRELDQYCFEFRNKGMNGTPEEREAFLKQIFHAARGNAQVAIMAAPLLKKTEQEVFDALSSTGLVFAAEQAKETGYDDRQTELYVDAHRKAYESLAERNGLEYTPVEANDD